MIATLLMVQHGRAARAAKLRRIADRAQRLAESFALARSLVALHGVEVMGKLERQFVALERLDRAAYRHAARARKLYRLADTTQTGGAL